VYITLGICAFGSGVFVLVIFLHMLQKTLSKMSPTCLEFQKKSNAWKVLTSAEQHEVVLHVASSNWHYTQIFNSSWIIFDSLFVLVFLWFWYVLYVHKLDTEIILFLQCLRCVDKTCEWYVFRIYFLYLSFHVFSLCFVSLVLVASASFTGFVHFCWYLYACAYL